MARQVLTVSNATLSSQAMYLLELCAIAKVPWNSHTLAEMLRRLGGPDADGPPIRSSDVYRFQTELVRQGLLKAGEFGLYMCAPQHEDRIVQEVILRGKFGQICDQLAAIPPFAIYRWDDHRRLRECRNAFYRNQVDQCEAQFKNLRPHEDLGLLKPFNRQIFARLDPRLQKLFFVYVIPRLIQGDRDDPELLPAFDRWFKDAVEVDEDSVGSLLDLAIARGDLAMLRQLDARTQKRYPAIEGSEAFLQGDYERALRCLSASLPYASGRGTKSSGVANQHLPAVLYALLLLRDESATALERLQAMIVAKNKSQNSHYNGAFGTLAWGVKFRLAPLSEDTLLVWLRGTYHSSLQALLAACLIHWFAPSKAILSGFVPLLTAAKHYQDVGLRWCAADAQRLLPPSAADAAAPMLANAVAAPSTGQQAAKAAKVVGLFDLIRPEPQWQRSLNAIARLGCEPTPDAPGTPAKQAEERILWEISVVDRQFDVVPIIQKRTNKGWSAGRKMALQSLYDRFTKTENPMFTDQDRAACRSLSMSRPYGNYGDVELKFDLLRLARALVGHPRVFRSDQREVPLEVVEQPPRLVVTREDEKIRLALTPPPRPRIGDRNSIAPYVVFDDGPRRVVFVFYNDQHQKLHQILSQGLEVPVSAVDQVIAPLRSVSALVAVHSEIGGDLPAAVTVDGDPRPNVHLLPWQGGLRAEIFVRPFGDEGPFCPVGDGGVNVFATIGGLPKTARRDLKEESRRAAALVTACPALDDEQVTELPSPVAALEALLQLDDQVAAGQTVLHWPQGESLKLAGRATPGQFKLQIRRDRDWFAATGSLKVNSELSIDMMKLIELVGHSSSRFVQLDDGRFLALTDQLRRRIEELGAIGDRLESKIRFPAIRAVALEDLGDVEVKADKHWQECLQRMRDAASVRPTVPSTLQAELRDYQQEGFEWLGRLAAWGVGGCLADDMGLGKTVEAIALLLHRAAGGPALVVAPTSVAFNWVNEINRFAPTLNVRLFGAGNRDTHFQDLGPRDVVISSYGLLYSEAERFQQQAWHSVVLDEAQAIKNMATRRSQAAMGLQSDFRLIMTGTPLENHLGELWNLFQFINPGLLGSRQSFQQNFAAPIERDHCPDTRRRLKKLIQPFLLRRTKTQVLSELPSRTEVTLQVELSEEEAAFYEALRVRALDKLSEPSKDSGAGPQHLRILAEIMRLRRACCHPKLAVPDCGLSSAKLRLFLETIDELLENHHKALVFSQFVDHLTILREALDQKGVSYQYLDGSTPAKDRKQRVEAFQSGEGDVFLISLRAGGLGLNLTAADYVLHMDPWWNPAVEDQASDRAHRLGQQRPVTIYRFITKGTIEERITDLHVSKRDLADSLLEGADISSKLSAEELLKMIRD